ncbi:sorting nexin-6-like [Corticium candelabrum]|uniref:sorting nexin-6-like n=1 Tax=Corticium candelabrum TaxID=121492 RepID=UPI002E254028|nr:sorting nexin-6-like [Corticium candelabrum]
MMDGSDHLDKLDLASKTSSDVDLSTDTTLIVDISDALSEQDKVKFTVHTKTTLPFFKKSEFNVVRLHEEFVWLHDRYLENDDYAGILIPPSPPRPNFDESREKLAKLGQAEGTMTKSEFQKMKVELEAEYLATFKKTVAMHEVFLSRLASHSTLRADPSFKVFLEYEKELSVRGKNKKEKLGSLWKDLTKSVDEALIGGHKDSDEFFEHERVFLVEYNKRVKEAAVRCDRMAKSHKVVANCHIAISTHFGTLGTSDTQGLSRFMNKLAEVFDRIRKVEGRVSSDEDLKLGDLLRYYDNDTKAAKDLLYRRMRSLVNFENSNKALEKARTKSKDVEAAQKNQQIAKEKFDTLSDIGKEELQEFRTRRLAAFKKGLVELTELELKHAKAQLKLMTEFLTAFGKD